MENTIIAEDDSMIVELKKTFKRISYISFAIAFALMILQAMMPIFLKLKKLKSYRIA